MSPADLPRFKILAVLTDRSTGQFDPSSWVGENWIIGLYVSSGRFVWGRFRDINMAACTCSFSPDQLAELSALRPNESYPFMDGYWGERAELVLDESRRWQRTVFEPRDMVLFSGPGETTIGARSSPDEPAEAKVLPGGWDHEHCEICNSKIGRGGEPEGFFSQPDAWVCQQCYNAFVVPKSLAFVNRPNGIAAAPQAPERSISN